MYNIFNEAGELFEHQVSEERLIEFANEAFAETDNVYDAQMSLEAFGFTVEEL